MNEANFILRWEQEHFGRLLRTRERKAVETILASIEHFQGQMGLTQTAMVAALQARLSNKATKLASPPLSQSPPVTTNKCTRVAAA
jgi:hypothetical protein